MASERRRTERTERAEQRKKERSREWADRLEREASDKLMSMSFRRKLDRASKHIDDLRQLTQAWLGTNVYSFRAETNSQTGRTLIRAHITEPPPPGISVILGDAAHNLRAALDHLALELAVFNHRPGKVPDDIESASEFPIIPATVGSRTGSEAFNHFSKKTGEPVKGSGVHKLRGAHVDAIKAIEGIQPYHRGAAYVQDPLWLIHELDRIDKHRRLNLTAYAVGEASLSSVPGDSYIEHLHIEHLGYNGPVEDGTVVAAFTARNAQFQLHFSGEIALTEIMPPNGVVLMPAITSARDYVRDIVVPLLEPWL
jgi:hypothetical protein